VVRHQLRSIINGNYRDDAYASNLNPQNRSTRGACKESGRRITHINAISSYLLGFLVIKVEHLSFSTVVPRKFSSIIDAKLQG
jgi:hypothetical protein